ncbi:MAG: chemotaxis protein CheW, partial [Planctomycetes bacterium]|nr:chemotaxis protein CheW [Planctomycetota bacterium]
GINVAKVKAKAVERGLITAAEAAVMSDSQARMLIFAAGLSTAEQVTNISGRGVGMDVVRSSVERIGGTIELDSELGKGTTIRIRIPLTLAIIPALIVGTGNEMFAIPQVNLHELVRLEADDSRRAIEQVQGADVYRLRGKLLPLVRLRDVLQIKADKPADDSCNILVLNLGQTQFGLLVDQVFDTEEIVVKPLSRHLKKLGCYAGATIMGDGRVALILDAEGLLRRSRMAVHTDKGRETRGQGSREGRTDAINMLVFSLGADDRFAVPLTLVNRLEEFEAARVERIGTREVIQYRDDILPLFDVAGMLDVEPPVPDDNGMWSVVVVTLENRSVGIKVRRIIDVAESTANFSRSAGTRAGVLGAGIMQGRTTVYLDLFRLVRDAARDLFEDTTVRAAPLTGLSALVVDDSRFFRTLEASYLEAEGMQVEQCADSGKALELIAEHSFDLLVFDIEMPGMDGVELTSRVRALAGMAERPILVVSGALDEVNRKRVEEAGATGYRSKLEHKSFLDGVRQVLKARAGAGA